MTIVNHHHRTTPLALTFHPPQRRKRSAKGVPHSLSHLSPGIDTHDMDKSLLPPIPRAVKQRK